jgi:general stress protein CsbA
MTISEIGTIVGIVLTVATGTTTAAKYYADNEYVTNKDMLGMEIRGLERDVRTLERTNVEDLSDKQKWRLEDLTNEIERLKAQRQED